MNKLFTFFCGAALACASVQTASAQTTPVDSVFTAKTVEGVTVTYKIISNEDKTCSVGTDKFELIDKSKGFSIDNVTGIAINTNTLWKVTIPETVNGYKVVKIGDGAFAYCKGLKTINLPSTLKEIGAYSFQYAQGLDTLKLPDSVEKVGQLCFTYCTELKTINIPSHLEELSEGMFQMDTSLVRVDLPNTLKRLSKSAFYQCINLDNVVVPESIDSIPSWAFYDCAKLHNLQLPFIKYIGEKAFCYCKSLTQIDLQEGLEDIGNMAFALGVPLTTIKFPSTLKHLGTLMFMFDTQLTSIYCYMKEPIEQGDWGNHQTFGGFDGAANGNCTLYVPKGYLANYQKNDGNNWNVFKNTVEFDATTNGIRSISAATANNAASDRYFNLSGVEVPANTKGILIHNGKKILVK